METERQKAAGAEVPFCRGKNCYSTTGQHSPECLIEAAESQGWTDSSVIHAARLFLALRDEPVTFHPAPTPPEEIRCEACGCVVNEQGGGHHSWADYWIYGSAVRPEEIRAPHKDLGDALACLPIGEEIRAEVVPVGWKPLHFECSPVKGCRQYAKGKDGFTRIYPDPAIYTPEILAKGQPILPEEAKGGCWFRALDSGVWECAWSTSHLSLQNPSPYAWLRPHADDPGPILPYQRDAIERGKLEAEVERLRAGIRQALADMEVGYMPFKTIRSLLSEVTP